MAWEHSHFSGARWIGGPLPSLGDPPHWVGNWDRTLGLENSLSRLTFLSLFVLASLCLSISLFLSVFLLFSRSFSSVSLCLFFLVAEQLSPGPLSLRRPGKCSPSAAPGSGPYSFAWLINSGCRGPGNPAEPRGLVGWAGGPRAGTMCPWGGVSGMGGHHIPGMPSQPVCPPGRVFVGKVACGRGRPGQCPPGINSQGPRGLVPPPVSRLLCLSRPCWLCSIPAGLQLVSGGTPSSSSFQNLPTSLCSSGLALITREVAPAHPLKSPPSPSVASPTHGALNDRNLWSPSSRGQK